MYCSASSGLRSDTRRSGFGIVVGVDALEMAVKVHKCSGVIEVTTTRNKGLRWKVRNLDVQLHYIQAGVTVVFNASQLHIGPCRVRNLHADSE